METVKTVESRDWPVLYKRNTSGKLQLWRIWVEGNQIHTSFGQVDGALQTASDTIKEGKNLGKANETTPHTQALAEAQSKWDIQQSKKGYIVDKERALLGENDKQGEECQLAHEFGTILNGVFTGEQNHKIKYPAGAQPKLDGHRSRTKIDKTLWSRGHKPITSVPHILTEIARIFPNAAPKLDGELYNHTLKEDFEKITSIVKQTKQVHPEHELVEYHVYDVDEEGMTFAERYEFLQQLETQFKFIKLVPTIIVNSLEEVLEAHKKFVEMGYEGAIIRNLDSQYEGKRSYGLQKLKEFQEKEFKIVGIIEGRGKLQGTVGSFQCVTEAGVTFEAKMEGKLERLKEFFENHSLWEGKQLTVRFQNYTKKKNVPRFPVGLRIREDI